MNQNKNKLFEPALINEALKQSFIKLNPKEAIKNPVMFLVWVGTVVMFFVSTSVAFGQENQGGLTYNLILNVKYIIFLIKKV